MRLGGWVISTDHAVDGFHGDIFFSSNLNESENAALMATDSS